MSSTLWLTAVAMVAFAGNSLLARLALVDGAIDAAGFTGIRLASGAAVLALIAMRARPVGGTEPTIGGSWASALALFVYAIAFSLAYVKLGAAVGALVLFTAVQATMIGWGLLQGERPSRRETAGLTVAFAAFVLWLAPAVTRPDPLGTVLMIAAGAAWGVYSLRGKAAGDPMRATAGNFIRTLPLAVPLVIVSLWQDGVTAEGLILALASGCVASALGYIVWYRALAGLTALAAAIVQLSVPVIAALGAVLFLSETLSLGFVVAAAFVLGGIGFALFARQR
ncbi:MAG: DMT family transporter [Aurantimonas endophytica]|uniref:Drug/metabolite transporter (DMT)-like permease n=1 Tax=Aurantimonas endophytica TaxID=1522175 RepID=A0A7W6HGP8_9HYPH|nr:DMT family transporter [Aurantimonas endophytica]MBB4004884.1 drug/metabolite transporter (DMT)-like permease [Aurantimonas endophytica]MCO6405694.1 EamA family transporter [Aurantimonas endophytica]